MFNKASNYKTHYFLLLFNKQTLARSQYTFATQFTIIVADLVTCTKYSTKQKRLCRAISLFTTMLTTILLTTVLTSTHSWNLQNYGFQEHYYVSNLAIFRQRAFLTLPRSSCFNGNTSNPTLIELPWSGENTNVIIPRTKVWLLNIKKQKWGECRELQDAVSVDVDTKKGKLLVLDKGNEFCDAKIVAFNLFFNYEIGVSVLKGVGKSDLAVLVVDAATQGQRVFVGGLEGEIIVFFANTMRWRRVKLDGGLILTDSLAISRSKPLLFVTSTRSDDVFSLNLRDVEAAFEKQEVGVSNIYLLAQL